MKNTWIWIVVAILVIGGGYWLWQSQQSPVMTDSTQTQTSTDTTGGAAEGPDAGPADTGITVGATVGTAKTVTVTFNGDAYDPKTVTINKGDTVKFLSTGGNMWVASNSHPDHTAYSGTTRSAHCPDTSGTAFDQCAPGTSFSFTFNKTGSWGYHDHLNAGLGGTVIVQ